VKNKFQQLFSKNNSDYMTRKIVAITNLFDIKFRQVINLLVHKKTYP